MKKTEVHFDLVDATPDQIGEIISLITGLGDSVTTFSVRTNESKIPTRSSGKSGQYLYAPREVPESTDPTDPATDTQATPQRIDIRPDVKDVKDPAAPVKKEGEASPSNLKKYL